MPKPVLFAEDYSAKFDPKNIKESDPSAIPGWSEIVQANDLDKADALTFREAHKTAHVIKTKEDGFKVIGASPALLPIDFKWLRVNGPGGARSSSADVEVDMYMGREGFIPCTKEKFDLMSEMYGYEFKHNVWRVAEDGTIRRGYDLALFYRSGDVARKWEQVLAETSARKENSFPSTLRGKKTTAETVRDKDEIEQVLISL